jgi:hypothetical protein
MTCEIQLFQQVEYSPNWTFQRWLTDERTDYCRSKVTLIGTSVIPAITGAEEVVDVESANIYKVLIIGTTVDFTGHFQAPSSQVRSSCNMYPMTRPRMALQTQVCRG